MRSYRIRAKKKRWVSAYPSPIVVLVVTVTLIGMTAVFIGLFWEENTAINGVPSHIDRGFWDSLWWSLNQVLTLRGFERMYGASG